VYFAVVIFVGIMPELVGIMPESVKKCVGHFFQALHISNQSCRDYGIIIKNGIHHGRIKKDLYISTLSKNTKKQEDFKQQPWEEHQQKTHEWARG